MESLTEPQRDLIEPKPRLSHGVTSGRLLMRGDLDGNSDRDSLVADREANMTRIFAVFPGCTKVMRDGVNGAAHFLIQAARCLPTRG